jgi:hypothetical protein
LGSVNTLICCPSIDAHRIRKEIKRRTDEQKRGSDRRIELEVWSLSLFLFYANSQTEKKKLTEAKTQELKAKMARRQQERQDRGRDSLSKRSTRRKDSELERSPSPVRFGMDLEHANKVRSF